MRIVTVRFACFASLLCAAVTTFAQGHALTNVNTSSPQGVSGAGGSYFPTFTEEGWSIVFLSHANNLVTNDDSGLALDVFLSDVSGQSMELISVNRSGVGGGNADSMYPVASRYGTMIVFATRSSNLTTNDTNNAVDLFLGGSRSPETRLITTDRFGHGLLEPVPSNTRPLSTHPALGAGAGPDIVFQSFGTNLVDASIADTNNASDIFIYVPNARTNRLVSVARTSDSTADGSSHSPQFDSSSSFIGFISTATNLNVSPAVPNSNRGGDIYLVDAAGVMRWASPNTRSLLSGPFPAPPSTYSCFNFALSGNGAVVYQANPGSGYPSLYPTVLLYCPFGAPAAVRISTDSDPVGRPQISYDGTLVAYGSRGNVYVWNSQTQSNILVSANTNGLPGNGASHSPVMDRYGYLVVFVSRATDLVSNAPSGRFQIYMRSLFDGVTRLVSVNTNGDASLGDFEHSNIALPREGNSLIAFDSTASDLVAGDLNGQSDVFVRDLGMNQTRLISRRHGALPARTAPPMSGTLLPVSVSHDGRVIAFAATDHPAISGDTNIFPDLFVRDIVSGSLRRITSGIPGERSRIVFQAIVSPSGTHVAQNSDFGGPTLSGSGLAWRDLSAETSVVIEDAVAADLR